MVEQYWVPENSTSKLQVVPDALVELVGDELGVAVLAELTGVLVDGVEVVEDAGHVAGPGRLV